MFEVGILSDIGNAQLLVVGVCLLKLIGNLAHELLKRLEEHCARIDFESINACRHRDIPDRTTITRLQYRLASERLDHARDAFHVLAIQNSAANDDVRQLLGADAAHFCYTGTAVYENDITEILQFLTHPFEENFTLVFDIE